MVDAKKKGKRYTQEQIIRILNELKTGTSVEEICRTYGVAQRTLYHRSAPSMSHITNPPLKACH